MQTRPPPGRAGSGPPTQLRFARVDPCAPRRVVAVVAVTADRLVAVAVDVRILTACRAARVGAFVARLARGGV